MEVAVEPVERSDPEFCFVARQSETKDASLPSTLGPGSKRPFINFIVPAAYRQPMVNQAAWSVWYGSAKAVADVADALMKLRSPQLSTVRAMATMNAPKGRGVPSASVMLSYLGIADHRSIVREVMGEDFDRIDLASKLEYNLGHLFGNEGRDRLRNKALTASVSDLARTVVESFPILESLFQAGAFYRAMALPLLYLGALNERLIETSAKLSQPDRYRIEMAVNVLFTELPPYFAGLICSTCEQILKLFPDRSAKEAELVYLRGPMIPTRPLAEQMSESDFARIVHEVIASQANAQVKLKHRMPHLLDAAEACALSLRPGPNVLSIVYSQFCNDFAMPRWKTLIEALMKHAESMEVPFDQRTFALDLPGRDIDRFKGPPSEAIQLLRSLISSTYSLLDPDGFIQRADKQLAKARELETQISSLGANLTASAMLKIASLAQSGSAEIMANRGWFKDEVDNLIPLVRAWQRFYEEWECLVRKGANASTKQPAALSVVERLPNTQAVAVPETTDLQEKLSSTLEMLSARESEYAEMRTELYNLRTFKESLALPVHRPDPLAVNFDLMRRIAVRESISPTDVLLFVESIADGRVVVLDSAWKSAKDAAAFQYSGRMLDVITAMAFPYYDSLMAGNPDATARAILGNAYSANESETVSAQRRLRAQREFEYLGKTHFFERHLKAGNGTGLDGMRIHFDIIEGKVVIAYAGPHLECSTSN